MMLFLSIFSFAMLALVIGLSIFAVRMSYEKMCIRTRKPFKSWLGAGL